MKSPKQSLTPASSPSHPASNLHDVLDGIGATQGQAGRQSNPDTPADQINPTVGMDIVPASEFPKLMVTPETIFADKKTIDTVADAKPPTSQDGTEDILESTIESAKQIQQLAIRLRQMEENLESDRQQLQKESAAWKKSSQQNQEDLEKRWSQVNQQAAQVRLQQSHVMQLQLDIVKSQQAARAAMEAIVIDEDQSVGLVRELKVLQQELGGRFDYIARRWEHLYRLLENQRTALNAAQSVDDSVRWAS